MADSNFSIEVDRFLKNLTHQLDDSDLDIDIETADGKLVIVFESGKQLIISRQGATCQIWLAEPEGGWHFDAREGHYLCDKRGIDLLDCLEQLILQYTGEAISLT